MAKIQGGVLIEPNSVIQGDCLEVMKQIPDKSIDLVLTDPPYNIGIASWDKIENYIEWMSLIFRECARVLKDNGSLYFFHNKLDVVAELMQWIKQNTALQFRGEIIWEKPDFRAKNWKYPGNNNNLRSWFPIVEYCFYYTFESRTGLEAIYSNPDLFQSIKMYMRGEKEKIKKVRGFHTEKEFGEYINAATETSSVVSRHYFADSQWRFPTLDIYKKLQTTGYFQREYEELRAEYEELRAVHNLDNYHNNVFKYEELTSTAGRVHPCEKPIPLLERLIKCSSNENAVVFDPFAGSGTTALACIKTNRNYICIEKEPKYVDIINKRIKLETDQYKLAI